MAALGSSHRVVCVYGVTLIRQVRQPVWKHNEAPRQKYDHHSAPTISSTIVDDPYLLGDECSVLFYTCFDVCNQRLTVPIGRKDLLPRSNNLNGSTCPYGQQTCAELVRKKVDLAAEGSSDIGLVNPHH